MRIPSTTVAASQLSPRATRTVDFPPREIRSHIPNQARRRSRHFDTLPPPRNHSQLT